MTTTPPEATAWQDHSYDGVSVKTFEAEAFEEVADDGATVAERHLVGAYVDDHVALYGDRVVDDYGDRVTVMWGSDVDYDAFIDDIETDAHLRGNPDVMARSAGGDRVEEGTYLDLQLTWDLPTPPAFIDIAQGTADPGNPSSLYARGWDRDNGVNDRYAHSQSLTRDTASDDLARKALQPLNATSGMADDVAAAALVAVEERLREDDRA